MYSAAKHGKNRERGKRSILAVKVCQAGLGTQNWRFVLSHSDQEQWVRLEETYQELITGSQMAGTVPAAARDLLILEVQKASVS
jgi:hypothetical protein